VDGGYEGWVRGVGGLEEGLHGAAQGGAGFEEQAEDGGLG